MEVVTAPNAAAPAADPAALAPASAPTPGGSNAAASDGKTAPPSSAAREAFDRLASGQKPDEVNKALYAAPAAKGPATTPPTTPAAAAAASEQPAPDAGTAGWPDSLTVKDLNVLKRSQMDPSVWSAIPPANQTKILNGLRNTQAEQDRQFQKGRQAAAGTTGKDAPAPAVAPATQTPAADAQDQGTLADGTGGAAGGQQGAAAAAAAPAAGQPPAATAAAAAAADAGTVNSILSAQDLETLRSLGGPELAETLDRGFAAAVQPLQQQNQQLMGALEFLLNQHVDGQVNAAVGELAKGVGMDGLRPGHADYEKNTTALRAKAMLLHRAAGDPTGYPMSEAVKDAAASLFKTNTTQAAQAALLARVRGSLNGAPDRGDGTRGQRVALSPQERAKAIFNQLSNGLDPAAARLAVDG